MNLSLWLRIIPSLNLSVPIVCGDAIGRIFALRSGSHSPIERCTLSPPHPSHSVCPFWLTSYIFSTESFLRFQHTDVQNRRRCTGSARSCSRGAFLRRPPRLPPTIFIVRFDFISLCVPPVLFLCLILFGIPGHTARVWYLLRPSVHTPPFNCATHLFFLFFNIISRVFWVFFFS